MTRRGARAVAALGAICIVALVASTSAHAQTPTATPTGTPTITGTGRISGAIRSGTEGVSVADGVQVQLIVVDGSSIGAPVVATAASGKYAADVPIAAGRVIVPHVVYLGVEYFGDPVTFDATTRTATRDFVLYEVAHDAPQLAIASSTVTVVAIDREQGQIGLLREDMVANPGDRVFVGDARGVTLRIPTPTGTVEATGDNVDGTFAFDDRGVVTTTVPIRPGKLTSIVTRYVVSYDTRADQYALRVTTPLPAEQLTVRVPEGYAGQLRPETGARRVADMPTTGQSGNSVLQVVQSTGSISPGGGIVVNLVGLSKAVVHTNPLTERRGALLAIVLALAIVGGATAVRWRWSSRLA